MVEAGRITGLCFEKYAETLADRLKAGRPVDIDSCFKQVEAVLDRFHGLDLVHNDIHSSNIMFVVQDSEAVVIIDFGSCARKGCSLPVRRGPIPEVSALPKLRTMTSL
jgi:serine/threonine protein kinase